MAALISVSTIDSANSGSIADWVGIALAIVFALVSAVFALVSKWQADKAGEKAQASQDEYNNLVRAHGLYQKDMAQALSEIRDAKLKETELQWQVESPRVWSRPGMTKALGYSAVVINRSRYSITVQRAYLRLKDGSETPGRGSLPGMTNLPKTIGPHDRIEVQALFESATQDSIDCICVELATGEAKDLSCH